MSTKYYCSDSEKRKGHIIMPQYRRKIMVLLLATLVLGSTIVRGNFVPNLLPSEVGDAKQGESTCRLWKMWYIRINWIYSSWSIQCFICLEAMGSPLSLLVLSLLFHPGYSFLPTEMKPVERPSIDSTSVAMIALYLGDLPPCMNFFIRYAISCRSDEDI